MSLDRVCDQSLQPKVVVGSPTYVFVRAVARTLWVTVSTFYAVCAYLLWCGIFLLPLRFTCSAFYWSMEAVLFRFLQSLVSHWMLTAGYTGRSNTCALLTHYCLMALKCWHGRAVTAQKLFICTQTMVLLLGRTF